MEKVKLTVDALRVESFPTAEIAQGRGTVHAQQVTRPRFSCANSCEESCTCQIASICWSCIDC
jgi:hypothetical protein